MLADLSCTGFRDDDHLALAAAVRPGVGLCTIVGIEGSFSRRLGAQLAVFPDGSTVGDLADGCLERQLACDMANAEGPRIIRYGRGSGKIDFRLPCGGGVDILLSPDPDRAEIRDALDTLEMRRPTSINLAAGDFLRKRTYIPSLRLAVLGEGPEVEAVDRLCEAMAIDVVLLRKEQLALGRAATNLTFDAFTACLLLFHDHEWELALLQPALASQAFFIGAQGGDKARADRTLALAARGVAEEEIARLTSPVGLIPGCKSPRTLALSAISQIVDRYEQLRAVS